MSGWSKSVEVRIKYLDQHIEFTEKELVRSRDYRKRLVGELHRARQQEELQNAKS